MYRSSRSVSREEEEETRPRRRRFRDALFPMVSAGLLRFPETREFQRIQIDPKLVIFIALGFVILILVLDLTVPPPV